MSGPDDPASVNERIVPPAVRHLDVSASRSQRAAGQLQLLSLVVLVVVPVLGLVAVARPGLTRAVAVATVALLLLGQLSKLLRRLARPDLDWVRARHDFESAKAAAWRRCALGAATAQDSELARDVSAAPWPRRAEFYLRYRLDDQIDYYGRRGARHRTAARRWVLAQWALTAAAILVVLLALIGLQQAVVGFVLALLAASEAWLLFQRSDYLHLGYSSAAGQLRGLRERGVPADEAGLAELVHRAEAVLERELLVWTAIRSADVLFVPRRRPAGA